MKKIDKLILDLSIWIGYPTKEIKPIINAIYKRDYAYFCSQMADFDQPQERRKANEIFNSEMKDVNPTIFEQVILKLNNTKYGSYYHENFHSLNEED